MGAEEIVGLLIVLFALFFPLIRRFLLKKEEKRHSPSNIDKEEEKAIPIKKRQRHKYAPAPYDFTVKSYDLQNREFQTHIHPHFKESLASENFQQVVANKSPIQSEKLLEAKLKKLSFLQKTVIYSLILENRESGFDVDR